MVGKSNQSGGKRVGAGRKPGSGIYQETTTVMRVPESQKSVISHFLTAYANKQNTRQLNTNLDTVGEHIQPKLTAKPVYLNLYNTRVAAGFPSPADDHIEKRLDPSEFLIDQADATFFVSIQGESMIETGLMPHDKAVVDRSKTPVIGDIVLAVIDGEFTIKTLSRQKNGNPRLLPTNASGQYTSIDIQEGMQFEIWGVVTGSFRRFR